MRARLVALAASVRVRVPVRAPASLGRKPISIWQLARARTSLPEQVSRLTSNSTRFVLTSASSPLGRSPVLSHDPRELVQGPRIQPQVGLAQIARRGRLQLGGAAAAAAQLHTDLAQRPGQSQQARHGG